MLKKIFITLIVVMIGMTGCVSQKKEINQSTKTTTEKKKAATTELDDEDSVMYADANYFSKTVDSIIYYKQGKKYKISPNSELGKNVLLMLKKRFVHTAEQPSKSNLLKSKVSALKKNSDALEVKFKKITKQTSDAGNLYNFKRINYEYKSLFFPLNDKYMKYFIPLPNREWTFERLGDTKDLMKLLDKYK